MENHQQGAPLGSAASHQMQPVQPMGQAMQSQIQIGHATFVLPRVPVSQARAIQMRMAKLAGGPFLSITEMSDDDFDDSDDSSAFSRIIERTLSSINTTEVGKIIKNLCELTFNQSRQSKTDYDRDFDYKNTNDIKLAIWVAEELFSDFFTEFLKENLAGQVTAMVTGKLDSEEPLET